MKWLMLSMLVLSTLSCSEKKTSPTILTSKSTECLESEIQNEYVVVFNDNKIKIYKNTNLDNLLEEFSINSMLDRVSFIEPNYRLALPAKKQYNSKNFNSSWSLKDIKVSAAWNKGNFGQLAKIAVIDTEIDLFHPLLKNSYDSNQGEIGTDENGNDKSSNLIDDDQNGYIDDWLGPNFFPPSDPEEMSDHGTHVTGIIAAYHDLNHVDEAIVQGVAPMAKIIPIPFISNYSGGTTEFALKAIDYAVIRGANIINASWGGSHCVLSLKRKIESLKDKNIIFVSASGNEGKDLDIYPDYPSSFRLSNQIIVGSVGKSNYMSEFSNYGKQTVSIFAPGSEILSTYPNSSFGVNSGTSMSAPFVSAALAILYTAKPNALYSELIQTLLNNSQTSLNYINQSQGRLDIESALNKIAQPE